MARARSAIRRHLQLGFEGRVFDDQFLICDIKMRMERPAERWFWFDPPFNRGRSALLHKQADDVWRLDFQVGASADRDQEMDDVRWFSIDRAETMLAYANERALIPRARELLAEHPS